MPHRRSMTSRLPTAQTHQASGHRWVWCSHRMMILRKIIACARVGGLGWPAAGHDATVLRTCTSWVLPSPRLSVPNTQAKRCNGDIDRRELAKSLLIRQLGLDYDTWLYI